MIKTLAWVFGIVFLAVGILGFVPGVTSNNVLLGIFEVDTVHNIIHILSGALAIAGVLMGMVWTRRYFQVFGLVYALVTVIGFVQGDTVLGLITTNMADHLLHLVLSVALLWIGFGMKEAAAPTMSSGAQAM